MQTWLIGPCKPYFPHFKPSSAIPTFAVGLLGSDTNFIAMQSTAPEGRTKGTMNLNSDPNNPPKIGRGPKNSTF